MDHGARGKTDGRSKNGQGQRTWTDTEENDLKVRYAEGQSYSDIARDMGRIYGKSLSRGAIASKVRCLKLSKRALPAPMPAALPSAKTTISLPGLKGEIIHAPITSHMKISLQGRKASVVQTGPDGNDMTVAPVTGAGSVSLLDLEPGQCRMIVSAPDAEPAMFCGCRCDRGRHGFKSYCVDHHRIAVIPTGKVNQKFIPVIPLRNPAPTADMIGRRYNGL